MSSTTGNIRRVSEKDIRLVQNLIEQCLQLYMNQNEVITTLQHEAKIEPLFTELVWQKLEEENQDFFKEYHLRLMVKQQIIVFNKLLERQVELMRQICPSGVVSMPIFGGSRVPRNSSPFMFGPNGTVLETHPTIGDSPVPSSSSQGSNPQIYRNDCSSEFTESSDMLERYTRLPFLYQGYHNRLETTSEALNYGDFGSV